MATSRTNQQEPRLPLVSGWLMNGFEKYFLPRYLRKHFHVLACQRRLFDASQAEMQACGQLPGIVVYANHASWWDPMIAIFVRSQLMPGYRFYAPIDAKALAQYKIFERMGFYGIELGSRKGANSFLHNSLQLLRMPASSIWITPEGKFCDVRNLDTDLQPGLAHLAKAIEDDRFDPSATNQTMANTQTMASAQPQCVWFLPAAIEYVFWEERLPECLCWFGQPQKVEWGRASGRTKQEYSQLFTQLLRDAQKDLATASKARDSAPFEILLSGQAGSWSIYDALRRSLARWRGQSLSMEHHQGLWHRSDP